jgi:small-conductance mechanosensitive channel
MLKILLRTLLLAFALTAATIAGRAQEDPFATVDAARAELDRMKATLADPKADDRDLAQLRERIDPLTVKIEAAIAQIAPQLEAADQRLAQIGAKPAADAAPESADVSRERDVQTATRQKLDETIKRGRLIEVEAQQTGDEITQRRRGLLAQKLFERSRSVLDPGLWIDVVEEAPHDLSSVVGLGSNWSAVVGQNAAPSSIAIVAASLVVAFILLFPVRRSISTLGESFLARQAPKSRLRRSATALFRVFAATVAPLLAALGVFWGLKTAGWIPFNLERILIGVVWAAGFLGFAHGMIRALLSPGRPSWRLANFSDAAIAEIKNQPFWCMLIFVLGRLIDRFNETIVASLSASIATTGLFAVLNAVAFAIALRRFRAARRVEAAEKAGGEAISRPWINIARVLAAIAVAVVLIAAATGYVALAQFLANQVIWISSIISLAYLLLIVVDDLITAAFSSETGIGRSLSDGMGARPESLEQIGVVLSGLTRVILIAVAASFVLAPWGVESTDVFGWLRYGVTGVQLGGITISVAGVLGAIALVVIGVALTRGVQRWLDRDLLPKTRMDVGLKASISTAVGYIGGVGVIVISLAYLGFSLDRLAIVAGALSVGIGFGLQAIISNFVSGIILLAERPIKAGDWIVIGSDQGNVRRISVRSTEIELFDRSTLIVPNSDFVTKSVKNVTHGAPTGRVQIDLAVSSSIDPAQVKRVAMEVAKSHPAVLGFPEPQLLFNTLGAATNNFSLFCNVPSPRQVGSIKSDLNFALVKAFADAKMPLGGPDAPSMVDAVDRVAEALKGVSLIAPTPSASTNR